MALTAKELVENSWLVSQDSEDCVCFLDEALQVINTTKRTLCKMRIAFAKSKKQYINCDWYDGFEKDLEFWLHVEEYWTKKLEEFK